MGDDKVIDWIGATRPELCNEIDRLHRENVDLRASLEEAARMTVTDAEWERQRFIRDAAARIYVQGMMVPDRAEGVVTFQPRTCWRAAKELWDAKPEDC